MVNPNFLDMTLKANDPLLKSWVEIEKNTDFPIQNLPFGIFSTTTIQHRTGVAIGNNVVDIKALAELGYLDGLNIEPSLFENEYINEFMALGKEKCREVRNRISDLLSTNSSELQGNNGHINKVLLSMADVTMRMPVKIGDYTDFYSSIEHATNVGTMFRDPDNALLPNWKHLPVGYHGRASSIILSGTDIHRPKGQTKADDAAQPTYGPCRLLDFELEMAFITGKHNPLGSSISTSNAEDYIFGMVLFNDWSARDIQKWEYVPLGPFLAKNFASSISPWVVTLDALEPFKVKGPNQDPAVLPYLAYEGNKNYDINLEVCIQPENSQETRVCLSNFKYMYWNMCQQLAHHTVNGCDINIGDFYASGTISGKEPSSYGSMLELSWKGTKTIEMTDGSERKFINDMDTVTMRGYANKDKVRIGFGEVKTKVLPAI